MPDMNLAAAGKDDVILAVDGLKVDYATREGVVNAVREVSFVVNAGEVVALVGESGCGKTATALSILRLIASPGRITGGSIRFGGRDLITVSERTMRDIRGNEIAMIFQEPMTTLNPVQRMDRQIGEPLRQHKGASRRAASMASIELLRAVRIADAEGRSRAYPHNFSGGMCQRAVIAMGMACSPRLIVADEPTSALDVTVQAQVLDLLKATVRERQFGMLLITHDLSIVAQYAERVYVMYAGEVIEAGTIEAIYNLPKHPYSQALIETIPSLDQADDERFATIPGPPLNPLQRPTGCSYHPRCPKAIDHCKVEPPPLVEAEPGHVAACWVMNPPENPSGSSRGEALRSTSSPVGP